MDHFFSKELPPAAAHLAFYPTDGYQHEWVQEGPFALPPPAGYTFVQPPREVLVPKNTKPWGSHIETPCPKHTCPHQLAQSSSSRQTLPKKKSKKSSCPLRDHDGPACTELHTVPIPIMGCGKSHFGNNRKGLMQRARWLDKVLFQVCPPYRNYPPHLGQNVVTYIASTCDLNLLRSFGDYLHEGREHGGYYGMWQPSTAAASNTIGANIKVCQDLIPFKKHTHSRDILKDAFNSHLIVHDSHHNFYTDASKSFDGVGCSYLHEDNLRSFRIEDDENALTAELVAIYRALLNRRVLDTRPTTIITDSIDAIRAITMDNNLVLGQLIRTLMHISRIDHYLCWVPAHVGVTGNEKVDAAAKCAVNYTCIGQITCS